MEYTLYNPRMEIQIETEMSVEQLEEFLEKRKIDMKIGVFLYMP